MNLLEGKPLSSFEGKRHKFRCLVTWHHARLLSSEGYIVYQVVFQTFLSFFGDLLVFQSPFPPLHN